MEFRLLGPMEVSVGGTPVDTGPPRQRTVLAALLVDAGRSVVVDTVIDRVWGDSPPDRPRHALYVYIARLRKILERADGVRLANRSGGYVLDIDPDRVDLLRFSALIEQGRTQVEALRQALALWRGQPLADLPGEWVAQVRERCRRRHVEAATLWAQAELRAGNAGALVGPLATLAGEYPLVEPLAAELMRALHAAGLSVDALQCYTDLRRRLVEELGIEPALELQDLHRSILRERVSADPPGPMPQTTVPRQLPAAPWPFVGRPDELEQLTLRAARENTVVISAIDGAAGIGKTTLAVHFGHQIAHRFPDGQLYVNLRGFDPGGQPVEPSTAIRAFLDALEVAPQRIPADLAAQAAMLRSRLAGKRVLLVLDNARDAEQVRPLLPGTAGCLVIITSRRQLPALCVAEGAVPLTLGLLTTSEARELLTARLGEERVAREPAAVEEIIQRCGRLPLALAVAAARAATRPQHTLTAIVAGMRQSSYLAALDSADPGTDIRSVFSWSLSGITAAAARLFRMLGLHPGPDISLDAAASLAAIPAAAARQLLDELTGASLLAEVQIGRYTCHDLVRDFAAEQASAIEDRPQRDAATHRLLDHYLHTSHRADRVINPHRDLVAVPEAQPGAVVRGFADEPQALEWFATERRALHALINHAASEGRDTHVCLLDWTMANYLYRCGQWLDQAATARAAIEAARRGDDKGAKVRAHHNLARAHLQLGAHVEAEAELRTAIRLADEDDLTGRGNVHHVLSWVLERQGQQSESFSQAWQAFGLFQAGRNLNGQARALNTIGWFHAQQDDHDKALAFCQEALELLDQLGNREGQATTLHSIGFAQHHLGRHQEALRCYDRALALFIELQDRYYEAATLHSIGDTHFAMGDHDSACAAWRRALPTLEDLNHPETAQVRTKLQAATRRFSGLALRRLSLG